MHAPAEERIPCQVAVGHSLNGQVVVAQDGAGAERVGAAHQQATRQNSDRPFQRAHMDVHLEHLYILAGQTAPKRRR
jgi:hypothetical protein